MYVFKDEIQHQLRKEVLSVKTANPTRNPLPVTVLEEKISSEMNEPYPVSSVEIYLDKNRSYEFLYYEKIKMPGII